MRDYFRANGWPDAERLPSEGRLDRGDISGLPYACECKAKQGELGTSMAEARKEAANAGKPGYMVIMPWRSHGVDEAMVLMPLWLVNALMRADAPVIERASSGPLATPTAHQKGA